MFYQVVELMFLLLSASVKCSGCFCVGGDLVAMSSALMLLLSSDEWCSVLTSAPLTSFIPSPVPARSCPALSYSAMFHSQVLLRRLHGNCAHVCACLCLYACVFLRPCRPCGVNPPTCSGCTQTATEPHLLQHTTAALQVLHSIRTSGDCHTYTEVHRSKLSFNSLGKFASIPRYRLQAPDDTM